MTWLTEERLRLYPRALIGALLLTLLAVAAVFGLGNPKERFGGDFPAFHAAGELVYAGEGALLYDRARQAAAQADYLPGGEWLPYPYPPPLAVLEAVLAPLPYGLAFLVHTLGMLGCLAVAVAVLRPVLPRSLRWGEAAFAGAALFYPMTRALLGAQGTPLAVVLLALTVRALQDDRPGLAGLWAGLLLYKPQLGLPLVGLVLLRTRGRSVPASVAVAAVFQGVSMAVAGADWHLRWWAMVQWFQTGAQALEVRTSVSLVAVAEALLGLGSPLALGIGGIATLAVVVAVSALWWRPGPLSWRLAAAGLALPLIPPHGLFYDAGLAVVALWVFAQEERAGGVVALWVGGLGALVAASLGVQPLAAVLVVGFVWAVSQGWRASC